MQKRLFKFKLIDPIKFFNVFNFVEQMIFEWKHFDFINHILIIIIIIIKLFIIIYMKKESAVSCVHSEFIFFSFIWFELSIFNWIISKFLNRINHLQFGKISTWCCNGGCACAGTWPFFAIIFLFSFYQKVDNFWNCKKTLRSISIDSTINLNKFEFHLRFAISRGVWSAVLFKVGLAPPSIKALTVSKWSKVKYLKIYFVFICFCSSKFFSFQLFISKISSIYFRFTTEVLTA